MATCMGSSTDEDRNPPREALLALEPSPCEPRPIARARWQRSDLHKRWRFIGADKAPTATLSRTRRRAVLAAFRDRQRLEAALNALPGLGFDAARFGALGTPASFEILFFGRLRAAQIDRPGPFLVLDDVFAEPGGSRPVMKTLSRLPGCSGTQTLLVSEGWPLPIERPDETAFYNRDRILGAAYGRPSDAPSPLIILGLRLSDVQSAASVCQALLAINDGPVAFHDLRAP